MIPAIEFRSFTKSFGGRTAVDALDLSIAPGRVVGLLGPNGAGKSTAMRALVGLVHPTSGAALIDGVPFESLRDPARVVGVHLDGLGFETGFTGRRHLEIACLAAGTDPRRAEGLLETVGLGPHATKRVKAYSTGMRQRLGLALAMAGDPRILVLDEPANGLDPEGIRWLRSLLRTRSAAGTTILVSSHQLAELEHVVDEIVVLDRRMLFHGPLSDMTLAGGQTLEDGYFDLVARFGKGATA